MKETIINALQELKSETEIINSQETLIDWKSKATNIIIRIYGTSSEPEKQIKNLKYVWYVDGGNNVTKRRDQAYNLIDSIISEIERFGLPEKESEDKETMTINVTQNQNTKINISLVIESIQDELTGNQLKEIQEIIDSSESRTEKKVRIIEKLTKFGSDVATNILASILTNPNLYN